jgi:hypothetical protein
MSSVATITPLPLHRRPPHAPPPPRLAPAQQVTFDQLRGAGSVRAEFPADIGPQLRAALDDALEPLGDRLDQLGYTARSPLRVHKHLLVTVHGCEGRFVA